MIFKHVCKKANKYLAKIVFKEEDGEKWATTSEAVYNWAKKNFKDGDTVDVQYNLKNGQYFVSKISALGATGASKSTKQSTTKDTFEYTCEDCGAGLKDGKYKKCYNCNKKNPSKKTGGTYTKSPEVQESIKRQAIGHMTSRSLIALTGQVDVNNIEEIAESLYKLYIRLVG